MLESHQYGVRMKNSRSRFSKTQTPPTEQCGGMIGSGILGQTGCELVEVVVEFVGACGPRLSENREHQNDSNTFHRLADLLGGARHISRRRVPKKFGQPDG